MTLRGFRGLAFVLVALAACCASAEDHPAANEEPGDQGQCAEQQAPQRHANDKEVSREPGRCETNQHAHADDQKSGWWGQLDVAADVANVALTTVVVSFGVLAYFLTLKLERPWLIPQLTDENVEHICELLRQEIDLEGIYIPSVHLAVSNNGRVPGWIIERCISFKRMSGAELPVDPPYEKIEATVPTPVPDDKAVQQLSRVLFVDYVAMKSIRDGESTLVFYGYFKYRGLFRRFGRVRETRFCWVTTRQLLDGPPNSKPRYLVRFDQGGPPNWTRYT